MPRSHKIFTASGRPTSKGFYASAAPTRENHSYAYEASLYSDDDAPYEEELVEEQTPLELATSKDRGDLFKDDIDSPDQIKPPKPPVPPDSNHPLVREAYDGALLSYYGAQCNYYKMYRATNQARAKQDKLEHEYISALRTIQLKKVELEFAKELAALKTASTPEEVAMHKLETILRLKELQLQLKLKEVKLDNLPQDREQATQAQALELELLRTKIDELKSELGPHARQKEVAQKQKDILDIQHAEVTAAAAQREKTDAAFESRHKPSFYS